MISGLSSLPLDVKFPQNARAGCTLLRWGPEGNETTA